MVLLGRRTLQASRDASLIFYLIDSGTGCLRNWFHSPAAFSYNIEAAVVQAVIFVSILS